MKHISFNEELLHLERAFPISNGLCPQVGQQVTLGGKVASLGDFNKLKLRIKRCNTEDPSCADDKVFKEIASVMKNFYIYIPFIT